MVGVAAFLMLLAADWWLQRCKAIMHENELGKDNPDGKPADSSAGLVEHDIHAPSRVRLIEAFNAMQDARHINGRSEGGKRRYSRTL